MLKYVIDENLPYYFKLWNNPDFIHIFDLPNISTDEEIWEYAKKNNLTIITKDADFSNKIMLSSPPPKIVHLKIGNMKITELFDFLNAIWSLILVELENHKLINVFKDRIESLE